MSKKTWKFVGVDIGGSTNTWAATLELGRNGGIVCSQAPVLIDLWILLHELQRGNTHTLCIDAQLTWSLNQRTGMRPSDKELSALLPSHLKSWVCSQNSLMAVPVRGRALAQAAAPFVGTLIETHPRAAVYMFDKTQEPNLVAYKPNKKHKTNPVASTVSSARQSLWDDWVKTHGIYDTSGALMGAPTMTGPDDDGSFDALVCATIALEFSTKPLRFRYMSPGRPGVPGFGPMVMPLLK